MTTTQNLTINAGEDTQIAFVFFESDGVTPLDISAATRVELQARLAWNSATTTIDLNLGANVVVSSNQVTITFPAALTLAIPMNGSKLSLLYNIEVDLDSKTIRAFEGTLFLQRDINHT